MHLKTKPWVYAGLLMALPGCNAEALPGKVVGWSVLLVFFFGFLALLFLVVRYLSGGARKKEEPVKEYEDTSDLVPPKEPDTEFWD